MNAPMWSAVEYDIDKNQISVKECELSCNGVLICKGSIQEPIMYVFNELYATLEEQKMAIASPVFATKEQCEDNYFLLIQFLYSFGETPYFSANSLLK